MTIDYTRLLDRLNPESDGEQPARHRSGVVTAVNADGTVNVTISGVAVPSVSVIDGANVGVGDTVQILTWPGDMVVLGRVRRGPGGGMTLIEQIALDSVTTFASVPQKFTDLYIEVVARSTTAAFTTSMVLAMNGIVSGGLYSYQEWKVINTTVSAVTVAGGANQAKVAIIAAASAPSAVFANVGITFPDYRSTLRRMGRSESSVLPSLTAATNYTQARFGFEVDSTAAVTSLTFITVGSFVAGSVATLYGRG